MGQGKASAEWLGLSGKVAVVTGAVGGVGKVLMQSFLDAVCAVAPFDRDQARCDKAAAVLRLAGAKFATGAIISISQNSRAS